MFHSKKLYIGDYVPQFEVRYSELENRLGTQLIVELSNCDPAILNDVELIKEAMEDAATIAGAHIVKSVFHNFNPVGISGVVVIAESHLAIHTWPEYGFASVDVFTCGETVSPHRAMIYLKSALGATELKYAEISRGNLSGNTIVKDTPFTIIRNELSQIIT